MNGFTVLLERINQALTIAGMKAKHERRSGRHQDTLTMTATPAWPGLCTCNNTQSVTIGPAGSHDPGPALLLAELDLVAAGVKMGEKSVSTRCSLGKISTINLTIVLI